MQGFPLATEPLGFLGVLIFIIIALLFFGVFIAVTFGPIALVIAAIVRAFRNSAATTSTRISSDGVSVTTSSSSEVVVTEGFGGSFGQAFGASLQRALGPQLGQAMGQMLAMAAAQHPVELQLAPLVMAIDAARRDGNMAPVRPFLTDRFASRFPSAYAGGQGGATTVLSHMALMNEGAAPGDHVVMRIDRGAAGGAHSEYWSFQRDTSAVPDGTPVVCPRCGAPTAGDHRGSCRFCGATFSTTAPALPQPTRWLLDDISSTPPALAA